LRDSVSVIETSKPHSTHIGGERPLSKPDLVFELLSDGSFALVVRAVCVGIISSGVPSLVLVMVNSNFINVIISKEIIPSVRFVMERIVENEMSLWSISLNHLSYLSVEVFKDNQVGVLPWFIDWLESCECAM